MLTRRVWTIERCLAFAPIEAGELAARQCCPHYILAVDIHAARSKPGSRCFRVVEWHLVVFRQCRVGRIASRNEAYDAAGHTERGSPNGAINRTRANAVERNIDPLILRWIHWLIDIYKRVTLTVAVGIKDEWGPALSLLFVLGLKVYPGVEETFDNAAAREPQNILIVQIQMMRSEAGVDSRDLFGFRIVDLNLPSALNDWKCLGRRMIGSFAAERHCLILANPRGNPHACLIIHGEAMGIGLARPDRFVTPVGRGLHRFRLAFARGLGIANGKFHLTRRVLDRIDDRDVIGRSFKSAVDRPICVDGGIPLVA